MSHEIKMASLRWFPQDGLWVIQQVFVLPIVRGLQQVWEKKKVEEKKKKKNMERL